jgi:two-component system response regulator HydG
MSVTAAVAAGADLIVAFNAGLYRNLGCGSLAAFLPYGDANAQTEQLLCESVLPRAGNTPVMAGLFSFCPDEERAAYLQRLRALGVSGVTNWPSLGFIDGQFREALAEEGYDVAGELRGLAEARALGFVTMGFAHTDADARFFAAECDGLILNVGLTHELDVHVDRRDRIQVAIGRLNRMIAAADSTGRRPVCLLFGGPITSAADFQIVTRQSSVDGFAGGSVFERLPVRRAIEATVRQFRGVSLGVADDRLGGMVGNSPAMVHLFDTVRRVARYDVNVCIEGPTGTGKELVATHIHRLSSRAHEPFVTLNCGAIPDSLVESELFGYERGAFTGADRRRAGKFELADRGTLFLDEVADLSPKAQVALLRAIQQGEIVRVGGDKPVHVDVRIVTATHQSLGELVASGRFRADLFYRLNQVSLGVPPLKDRRDDIPLLVSEILTHLRIRLRKTLTGITPGFSARLLAHDWPGNVRELEHVICRAAILEDAAELEGSSFTPGEMSSESRTKRTLAEDALRAARGNKSVAAARLGISRKTFYVWFRGD